MDKHDHKAHSIDALCLDRPANIRLQIIAQALRDAEAEGRDTPEPGTGADRHMSVTTPQETPP